MNHKQTKTKKTTTKKKSVPNKKTTEEVVEVIKQEETEVVDTSAWKSKGFPSEKYYKRFLGIS